MDNLLLLFKFLLERTIGGRSKERSLYRLVINLRGRYGAVQVNYRTQIRQGYMFLYRNVGIHNWRVYVSSRVEYGGVA